MMPMLNSHAHCQAAHANAQTKAWQRVCLPQRSTKSTEKRADEKEARLPNITYTQAGVSCFVGVYSGLSAPPVPISSDPPIPEL